MWYIWRLFLLYNCSVSGGGTDDAIGVNDEFNLTEAQSLPRVVMYSFTAQWNHTT